MQIARFSLIESMITINRLHRESFTDAQPHNAASVTRKVLDLVDFEVCFPLVVHSRVQLPQRVL